MPMLRAANCAVAVANAVAEVRAAAHVVIGPNTAPSVPAHIAAVTRCADTFC